MHKDINAKLEKLAQSLEGELLWSQLMRTLYATDASVYKVYPLAVCYPKSTADIQQLIRFANEEGVPIIPRAAGTSLAGQCVGEGIVVDVSKHMTGILEFNAEEGWIRLQPGVIRDELNRFLAPYGWYFGPNTATANRCMIGGMVGNNSCGSTSIVYGSTRDHLLEAEVVLSDGSVAQFGRVSREDFFEKAKGEKLENKLYKACYELLKEEATRAEIKMEYPQPKIRRRNTGYAIDLLSRTNIFEPKGDDFNFCTLLAGSEGTLAFTTAIKLNLVPLPEKEEAVVAVHFETIRAVMEAVPVIMQQHPTACEMMDSIILELSKQNREQLKNRFFVEGNPRAILMVEFRGKTEAEALQKAQKLIDTLKAAERGYAYPVITGKRTKAVWDLRKAGLGILGNMPGDKKAVACIEDTAVPIDDLANYIDEFSDLMKQFGQEAVYYAHAGDGELHLRPVLNLKSEEDRNLFYEISLATAKLVKKYKGSLSGEHGDGRVRAPFIPLMIGEKNYQLLKNIKRQWDPNGIFNPGKITDAPPMNESLRYEVNPPKPDFSTIFDFSTTGGLLGAIEKCNGSGDCRKLDGAGGTMCPSYRGSRDEKSTTRARANALREYLSKANVPHPFDSEDLYEMLDLCLSCKACSSECPSNVDMAKFKAEFLHQYYKTNKVPLRSRFFVASAKLNQLGSLTPALTNLILKNKFFSGLLKSTFGIAKKRELPLLSKQTLSNWYKKNHEKWKPENPIQTVWLFCDEVINFNDADIGIKAIKLLSALGYQVNMLPWMDSARVHISKGILEPAKKAALKNVQTYTPLISKDEPLIGIEPSAILGFRDEYIGFLRGENQEKAKTLAENTFIIDEFFSREIEKGRIQSSSFTTVPAKVLLHGHCHQKALSDQQFTANMLSLPKNYSVEIIPSGCCGMAGSFGYEKEHYELSQKIGELVLFPTIRKADEKTIIVAPGASCRSQIKEGVQRSALHPVEVLWEALLVNT